MMEKFMMWLAPKVDWLVSKIPGRETYWTLPWGNDGRGTKVYLWPFVGVAIVISAAWVIDNYVI